MAPALQHRTAAQGTRLPAKPARQIRNLLELIKDGHGSAAMVGELRDLERRQEELATEIVAAGVPEPVPVLHRNLPELYRAGSRRWRRRWAIQ